MLSRRSFLFGLCACCAVVPLASCTGTGGGLGGLGQSLGLSGLSPAEEAQLGAQSWEKIKSESKIASNPQFKTIVGNITNRITKVAGSEAAAMQWEYEVFENPDPNAFALPGGKVGVNTGLFTVAKNEHQVATVLGHEVRHVTGHHGAQRYQQEAATNAGLQLANMALGNDANSKQIMSLLGAGAQVGLILPFSREQETEADLIGLEYMAAAGFDPRESVAFWQNMQGAGGGAGPAFLSTHPSGNDRIAKLTQKADELIAQRQKA
jgi:predicted Zn-dependent protease